MKTILGLDLGITSIGWALIREYDEKEKNASEILGIGTRIIPLSPDENDEFSKGNSITKNQQRTIKRTMRKGLYRYKLRKKYLNEIFEKLGMLPDKDLFLNKTPVELYGLRDKALHEKISLQELGRIFYHLNQRRGYKSSRKEDKEDNKITEYEQKINDRSGEIKRAGITIGQYFYTELLKDSHFRIKEKVFPRSTYIDEFNVIWNKQKEYYPQILSDENLKKIRDEIIFYQRPLKSQKGLVSICDFEGRYYEIKGSKTVFSGPRVAPKSSPLFQVCKIWESINNITIKNKQGEPYEITPEKKEEIFQYLDLNEKLSQTELFKLLGIGRSDGYFANIYIAKKGIQGNLTKSAIIKVLGSTSELDKLIEFNLGTEEYEVTDFNSGEVLSRKRISASFEKEPLYKLWHIIYSIAEEKDVVTTLKKEFNISDEKAKALSDLDFKKGGFGNKSAKAIRNILPYLKEGFGYSDACQMAGYNHSDSITKDENLKRVLQNKLKILPKNSLRQPVVEKILNQMINLVNAIIDDVELARPDEIRIELARELKQSKDERNETFSRINKIEREKDAIRKKLLEHPEFKKKRVSLKDIERYRLWEEFDMESPYEPGKKIGMVELYSGLYDVEHIIAKSRLFDDSFSNKTICPRHLNSGQLAKNQMTAFDFMKTLGDDKFNSFIEMVNANKKISRTKRERLLMSMDKIPQDFIARQLRETQYIARKSREILSTICRNNWVTSGSVTDYLRNEWGWNDVLVNLNIDKFRNLGKTEIINVEHAGQKQSKEIILDWSKRDDHRHHAIDALTVACTRQGIIQRLNNLNQILLKKENQSKQDSLKESNDETLKKHIASLKPFTTKQVEKALAGQFISFKAGKRAAVLGKRKIKRNGRKITVQSKIIVPRGPLSEESVYGKIKKRVTENVKLTTSFKETDKITDRNIRKIILQRLAENENEPAKAFKSLTKNPILIDGNPDKPLTLVSIWKEIDAYVIKYPIQNITTKDIDSIVDLKVREIIRERLNHHNGNHKEAFKDLENNPLWYNQEKGIKIKAVRCFTGLNVVEEIAVRDEMQKITFNKYVKPGSNHHVAIYMDAEGQRKEHVVTFWHAVQRKMKGIPIVITKPDDIWEKLGQNEKEDNDFLSKLPEYNWKYITSMQQNELFVFNMNHEAIEEAIGNNDFELISKNLFRLRKITSGAYWFNHQYETQPRESIEDKNAGRCIQASLGTMNGIKIKINNLGKIASVSESNHLSEKPDTRIKIKKTNFIVQEERPGIKKSV